MPDVDPQKYFNKWNEIQKKDYSLIPLSEVKKYNFQTLGMECEREK